MPWWDDNSSKAIKMRNRIFRQLKVHHTLDTHSNNMTAINIIEKAELLAKTFVKIHSSENLSEKAKLCRDKNPCTKYRNYRKKGIIRRRPRFIIYFI